ncbi:MAG: metal ABC transporter ATP-binding protein [Planctomycetaceae bacterium]|jgi:zinc transport system ATP-binding protein|nr:metal ABC transporter ATP-binding protein [Planctomycetaceae bacterium]
MNAVEFQSVSFAYDTQTVVENAVFSITQGEFACVIGPNGGGKTTLLKLMLGLLTPKSGSIQLLGKPPKANCAAVGYTPQFLTVDFDFPISVLDVVLMGRMRSRHLYYNKRDKEAAYEALRTLKLEDCAGKPFHVLSGGQRQRVLIARAVCSQPQILLLDEPTNNIDANSEQILCGILEELNQSMTVIMVSHDVGFVAHCVNKVICVNRTVSTHTAAEMNGSTIHDLYGGQHGIRIVMHDHQ